MVSFCWKIRDVHTMNKIRNRILFHRLCHLEYINYTKLQGKHNLSSVESHPVYLTFFNFRDNP